MNRILKKVLAWKNDSFTEQSRTLFSDNVEDVISTQDVATNDVEVDSDGDVTPDEGLDDFWDVRDGQGDGARGIKVTVLAGVQGQSLGLTSWGELSPQISRDNVQQSLSLIGAGSNLEGEISNSHAWKGDSLLDHLEVQGGSLRESLDDVSVEVDHDLSVLLGLDGIGPDVEGVCADILGIVLSGAVGEVGAIGKGQGQGGGEDSESNKGLHGWLGG